MALYWAKSPLSHGKKATLTNQAGTLTVYFSRQARPAPIFPEDLGAGPDIEMFSNQAPHV